MTRIAPRVLSLLPSATEIVCALGCHDQLVGRSHECDFPESVQDLPVCTKPCFSVTGNSRDIDREVKNLLHDGLSLYHVHLERLAALQPDVIVTQLQCEVCAVSVADVETAAAQALAQPAHIVSLSPQRLGDIWTDITRVAEALGTPRRAERIIANLTRRVSAIADRVRAIRDRPTVACLEWLDPLMSAGNWVPELVDLAGGTDQFGIHGRHSSWLDWEQLTAADPDIILIMPCGFGIARARAESAVLTARPEWPRLAAVRHRRVFVVDGHQYFNRPGPRLVESLEIVAELLYPEIFSFGHAGTGWIQLEPVTARGKHTVE